MSEVELHRCLEAILMVVDEPVSEVVLAQIIEAPTEEITAALLSLSAKYVTEHRGFELRQVSGGWRYYSHPEIAPLVEKFVLDGQQARVSSAALETLAIIAYKQPLSRSQIASIRGVDPEAVMRTLQARGYITEVQRDDGPGQAVLFGTTPLFLERLGIASLEDLPSIADFIPDASVVESLERGLRVVPDDPTLPEQ